VEIVRDQGLDLMLARFMAMLAEKGFGFADMEMTRIEIISGQNAPNPVTNQRPSLQRNRAAPAAAKSRRFFFKGFILCFMNAIEK
jgi:hypothetical protein